MQNWKFKYEETASIEVDPQRGFSPLCPNELPVPDGHNIVEALNEQAKYAKIRIVTMDTHPSNALWVASNVHPQGTDIKGYPNLDVYWNSHCIIGTEGWQLLPGLLFTNYDYEIFKGMWPDMHPYGACYHDLKETISTGLIKYLQSEKIRNVVLGGLCENYCVATTAFQLVKAGFNVCINLEATRHLGDPAPTRLKMFEAGIVLMERIIG
jgi:nicotinamidase/pyrazinamidase